MNPFNYNQNTKIVHTPELWEVRVNASLNRDGTQQGWIDGSPCVSWSDSPSSTHTVTLDGVTYRFTRQLAEALVIQHNDWVKSLTPAAILTLKIQEDLVKATAKLRQVRAEEREVLMRINQLKVDLALLAGNI